MRQRLFCAGVEKGGRVGAGKTIARIDNADFREGSAFSYQSHFGIDEMFSPKLFAALELASFIRNPGSLAVEYFAQGMVVMRQVIIEEGSGYIRKKLKELDIPKDVRIACITRNTEFIIPTGDTSLRAGDTIILIGETKLEQDDILLIICKLSDRKKTIRLFGD